VIYARTIQNMAEESRVEWLGDLYGEWDWGCFAELIGGGPPPAHRRMLESLAVGGEVVTV
jgi:hypothetical protein